MIAMRVDIDSSSRAMIKRMQSLYPREMKRAFARAVSIVARKIRARMNPRNKLIAPWQSATKVIRNVYHRAWSKKMGGRLMYPRGKQVAVMPEGDGFRVGWIGALEPAAIRFQVGGSQATRPAWRRMLYVHGVSRGLVPHVAVTPARPVIEPVAEESSAKLADWTLGAFSKILETKAARAQLRYRRTSSTEEGIRAASAVAKARRALSELS